MEKYNVHILTLEKYRLNVCKSFFCNLPYVIKIEEINNYYHESYSNNYNNIYTNSFEIFENTTPLFNLDILKCEMLYELFILYSVKKKLVKPLKKTKTNSKKQIVTKNDKNKKYLDTISHTITFFKYIIDNEHNITFTSLTLCNNIISTIISNVIIDYIINNIKLTTLDYSKLIKLYYFNNNSLKSKLLNSGVFFNSFEVFISTLYSYNSWYITNIMNIFETDSDSSATFTITASNYLQTLLILNGDKFITDILKKYYLDNFLDINKNIIITLHKINKIKYFECNNKNIDNKFNLFYYMIIQNIC
jgi:hypothetical protein